MHEGEEGREERKEINMHYSFLMELAQNIYKLGVGVHVPTDQVHERRLQGGLL